VCGVELATASGQPKKVRSAAVLLATGGIGQVYRETTNPSVATGDGVAMAYRAGAEISDMEFVQFHPTALYLKKAPRFLLSEALRGEGAYLRNMQLERFMPKYHEHGELAPRDVVARAIVHEIEVVKSPEAAVYLDLTHMNSDHVRTRFPRIYDTCMKYNVDITGDLIPVRPAAHYAMGGVRTDLDGKTSLPGLFAAGEVAATGVHGANRLASNSLLEGVVFGARAGSAMKAAVGSGAPHKAHGNSLPHGAAKTEPADKALQPLLQEIRNLMWQEVGIVRLGTHLRRTIHKLEGLRGSLPEATGRQQREARNMLETGLLIARSALAREESRGAHYRTDFPAHNDSRYKKHSVVRGEKISFE
jgi:L-aspartate oxidase